MTKAMTMTIKRAVSTVVAELNPLTSSTLVKEVMGEEQITLAWEQASFTELLIGDYIEHEGSRWTMNTLPTVKKTGTHSFRYDAVFQSTKYDVAKAVYMLFDNTPTPPKGEFSMTGNATMFMELLVANLNRLSGTSLWSLGQVVEGTEYITLTFSNEDCLSVLGRLADEFNTEYHVTNRIIHLKRFSTDRKITLKYGSSLYDIERVSVDSSGLVTRLYPYGSTRNLPGNYRGGSMPLCLPDDMGQYLESLNASNFGIVERSKSFDEIYPRLSSGGAGVVTDVGDALTFKDSALDFDVNDCLMDGTEAKVHFITGQCAGYDFEIQRYNHATKTFTLIPNQQENDFTLPTGDIRPAVGDKYVLLDIVMPDSYRLNAEQELADKASEWLEQNDTPKVSYRATFSAIYARQNLQNVECGDTVRIEDADMGIAEDIRIVKLTKGIADYWTVQFDLSDTVTKTTLQHIIGDIATVQNDVVVSNQMINENARRSYLNNKELREMVFDTDGYFDPENIKPLSIETSMLSVGARAQAFQLSILLQPNYAGNAQVLQWSAGLLAHFTMDDESVMEWALPAGSITITGSNQTIGLYIYAKCSRTASSGTLFLDAAQRKFDADPDYWYFLVGVLHSPVDGVRGISLTYGQTTINGRFIKTGRVQSADGNTFFDLDSGTIQGNIRFQSGQTVEAGIQEAVDGIEIGGRNLLAFADMIQGATSGISGLFVSGTTYITSANYIQCIGASLTIGAPNSSYHVHVCFFDESQIFITSVYLLNGGAYQSTFPLTWIIPERTKFIKITVKRSDGGVVTPASVAADCRIKIELGNKPTDWTPAPEDVQADIDDLASDIADIADDGKFTPNEKHQVRREWPNLLWNYLSWGEQGEALGIVTELAAMEAAFLALAKYLNNNVTWTSGIPLWISDAQLSVTTTVVPATFRARFADYYESLNALIAKIGEVNEANTAALGYLAEAIANDTTIQGGLISTSLIKVGAKQFGEGGGLSWIEKAGINGTGEGDDTPRIYAGGTLAKAVQRVAGILTNSAKFVVTQGGKIFGMDVELYGSMSTAPPGGKRILLDHDSSSMNIYDESGDMKATVSSDAIIALSKLLTPNSNSVDASQSISLMQTNGSDTDTKLSAPLILPATSDNYTITTPPVVCVCYGIQDTTPPGHTGAVGASASVSAFLVKADNSEVPLGSVGIFAFVAGESSTENLTIPSKSFGPLPSGTYKMKLTASVSASNVWATASASIRIVAPDNTLSGVSDVEVSRIYRNGIFLIRDANNYMYMNPMGVVEKSEKAPDRPGVLLAGNVASGGGGSNFWGPKKHSSKLSIKTAAGTYTVYHSAGHTGYTVQVTLGTKQSTAVVSSKTDSSFKVTTYNSGGTAADTAFEFAMFGEN
jgi:hypothetical protein